MKNLEVLGFSVLVCMAVSCNGNKASLESYLTPERNANLGKVFFEKLDSVVCEVQRIEYNTCKHFHASQNEFYFYIYLVHLKISFYDKRMDYI